MAKIINGSSLYLALANYLASNAYLNDTAQDVLEKVCVWIDEAKEIQVPKWIPVTERLPADWCPVLVMVRENEKPLLGSYRENVWFHERWNTTFINGAVTHWMPLPEPPKEVE